jgi:HAD superfamily hydrolase (TIGR01509 family)
MPLHKKVEAVIFDMDGLMLDTESITKQAFDSAMKAYDYPYEPDLFVDMIGYDKYSTRKILKNNFGQAFPFSKICRKMAEFEEIYIQKNGIPLKKGIVELLTFLEENSIPKGVGTTSNYKKTNENLEITGLKRFFNHIVTGDQVKNRKPAPDIYHNVGLQLGTPAKKCLVLEDSEPGIKSAYAAGMLPVMIPDFKQPSKALKKIIYKVLPDHFAVIKLLKTMI